MKCPFCNSSESKVIDSRSSKDNRAIRRRRECLFCHQRFTTYERIEEFQPMVVKKDGRREFFDRKKIIDGIVKACEKRPVSMDEVENFVSDLEKEIQDIGEREVESKFLGERIMSKLRVWDDVAYVRFASVYKQFKDLNEFMDQLQELLSDSSHNQNHS